MLQPVPLSEGGGWAPRKNLGKISSQRISFITTKGNRDCLMLTLVAFKSFAEDDAKSVQSALSPKPRRTILARNDVKIAPRGGYTESHPQLRSVT
jgi:hypothetical protein